MAQQLTKEQAIALAESDWWVNKTDWEIAAFQMEQDRLCLPFSRYHEAVEKVLGRPVYTHEFGSAGADGLRAEMGGDKKAPTIDEILSLIPEGKRVVIVDVGEEGA